MNKHYTSAPLPFMGQKRRFLKQFKTALKDFENAKVNHNAGYTDVMLYRQHCTSTSAPLEQSEYQSSRT